MGEHDDIFLRLGRGDGGQLVVKPSDDRRVIDNRLVSVRRDAQDVIIPDYAVTCLVLEPRILVDVRLEVLVSQNRSHVRHVRHHRRGPGVVWHVVVADGVDHRGLGHIYLGLEGRFEKFQLIVETSLTVILGTINQVTYHKDSGHSVGIVLKSLGLELLKSGLPLVRRPLRIDVDIADNSQR